MSLVPYSLVFARVRQVDAPKVSVVLMGTVAFALSFMLDGVVFGFDAVVSKLSDLELNVASRGRSGGGLPLAYRDRIQGIDGVASVYPVNGFSASHHSSPQTLVPVTGIEPGFLRSPGMFYDRVADEHLESFAATPNGAIIGEDVARRWGWGVNSLVSLTLRGIEREDGSSNWQFVVLGTYGTTDDLPSTNFYVRFTYVDAVRQSGKGRVGTYFVTLEDADVKDDVAFEIDTMFINSSDPTRTTSLKDRVRGQRQQMGNMNLLISTLTNSTFFAMTIVLLAVLAQSFRERASETAVMRAMGFGAASIVLALVIEASVYVGLSLLGGVVVARAVVPHVVGLLGLDDLGLPAELVFRNILIGVVLVLAIATCGVLAGWRRNIRDALESPRN